MNSALLEQINQQFAQANRILVVSHIRPDGDAYGSVLGLGLALQAVGKDVQMAIADKLHDSFQHLPGIDQIKRHPEGRFDLTVVVDSSDLERVGKVFSRLEKTNENGNITPDINIDHHVTNLNFARYNLVVIEAVATSEIIANALEAWGLPLTPEVAAALLTGIVTDTIGFRTSNMTAAALKTAARLMEAGADLPELYFTSLVQRSFEAARYWGAGLSQLQREGGLVWTQLSLVDRKEAGYSGGDDADLVNMLTSIDGADVAVIFVEQVRGTVKVSWRARPGYDVAALALNFGGGGHKAAAGAEVPGTLAEVREKVLEVTRPLVEVEVRR